MKKLATRFVLAATVAGAIGAGTLAFSGNEAVAEQCPRDIACTTIYDPVICNDGVVYSNKCFAHVACANGCRPYDPGPTKPGL